MSCGCDKRSKKRRYYKKRCEVSENRNGCKNRYCYEEGDGCGDSLGCNGCYDGFDDGFGSGCGRCGSGSGGRRSGGCGCGVVGCVGECGWKNYCDPFWGSDAVELPTCLGGFNCADLAFDGCGWYNKHNYFPY